MTPRGGRADCNGAHQEPRFFKNDRVWGVGFRVQVLRFRVRGEGLGLIGFASLGRRLFGSRVYGLGML